MNWSIIALYILIDNFSEALLNCINNDLCDMLKTPAR